MDKLPNTFLTLVENYNIEIPMIQRDYAQGRKDEKTKSLREHFISEIISHIAGITGDNAKELELDFIYGPIKNNTLIPIDGQQRLTTLFLLHWYLTKQTKIKSDYLMNFTYKVRTSTQDFLNALLDKEQGGNLTLTNSPKDEILDASWYYSMWDYDPSIQGMLSTLDAIHDVIYPKTNKDNKYNEKLWDNLNNHNPVQFNLLNMDQYNLSDELYLKMNARGLALSNFENFKAWLQGYCDDCVKSSMKSDERLEKEMEDEKYFSSKHNEDHDKKWTTKIDQQWTDFFWYLSDSNSDRFNNMFINFFNGMALFFAIENDTESKREDKKFIEKENLKLLRDAITDNKYIPFDYYVNNNCFSKENLMTIFKLLDMSNELLQIDFSFESNIFKKNIETKAIYKDRVSFYALYKYVLKTNYNPSNKNFKSYQRVMSNLIENSTIDSPPTFHSAIKSINDFSNYFNETFDILTYLNDDKDIKFFNQEQLIEEKLKAQLIDSDKQWEPEIIEAENHELFKGQINFLLNPVDELTLKKFENRLINSKDIFDKNGVSEKYSKDAIFLRAFISKCSKWEQLWQFTFDNGHKTWKSILANKNLKNEYWETPINKLLDINTNTLSLEKQIQTLNEYHSCFQEDMIAKLVHEDLYKSKLLSNVVPVVPGCLLHGWDSSSISGYTYILYPYNTKATWKMYVIATERNKILTSLLTKKIITLKWDNKLNDQPYYHGRTIIFIYKDKEFYWKENDNISCAGNTFHLNEIIKSESKNITETELIDFLEVKFANELCSINN